MFEILSEGARSTVVAVFFIALAFAIVGVYEATTSERDPEDRLKDHYQG